MTKIVCIYHSIDLDGWMSAAIVKRWFNEQNMNNDSTDKHVNVKNEGLLMGPPILNSHNEIDFIGYNYGEPIPNLIQYEQVIMCDISFPKDVMLDLFATRKLIWLDHHISAIKEVYGKDKWMRLDSDITGIQDTSFAACELTWQYFFPDRSMPEIVRLLGRYDCFGHKGTDEERKVLEFQYGARGTIGNYEDAYAYLRTSILSGGRGKGVLSPEYAIWREGVGIYKYLCTEAEQVYRNGIVLELLEPLTLEERPHKVYKFVAINRERFNPINFGIDYHEEGFDGCACYHRRADGYWAFSLYNDNGLVDCSLIAKQFGGGGHKGASGFIVENLKEVFG